MYNPHAVICGTRPPRRVTHMDPPLVRVTLTARQARKRHGAAVWDLAAGGGGQDHFVSVQRLGLGGVWLGRGGEPGGRVCLTPCDRPLERAVGRGRAVGGRARDGGGLHTGRVVGAGG